MATIEVSQEKKDTVSTTLQERVPASLGHYNTQFIYEVDPATHTPVSVRQEIGLGVIV
jgi:hypothetical protein